MELILALSLLSMLIFLAIRYWQTCPLCGGKLHYLGDDPIKKVSIYECEKCKEWFI